MGRRFFDHCAAAWGYLWRDAVSVRTAVFVVVILSGVFFLLGGMFHPQQDVRRMSEELQETRQDVRRFADKTVKQNEELRILRARNGMGEKTIALLNRQIEELLTENLQSREETLFYRQMFNNQAVVDDLSVYALDIEPDFAPRQWRLNAVLVRAGKNKSYQGEYFFEILLAGAAGEEVARFPAEARPFKMGFYYEIKETFALPKDKAIKNIRLTVVNQKKKIVASAELPEQLIPPSADG